MLPVVFDEDDRHVPSEGRVSMYDAVSFAVPASIMALGTYIAYRMITAPTIVDPMPPRPGPPLPPERDPLVAPKPAAKPLPQAYKPPPIARKEAAPKFSSAPPSFGRTAGRVREQEQDEPEDSEELDESDEGEGEEMEEGEMPEEP